MAKVSLRAYNREIEAMIDRGQLDEAIAHSRHILKTYPKHLETYRLLGKAYLEYKRYGDAADIFSRILVAVPNDFVAHVGMSIIRDEENRLDDAIWHMERAFETQPSNPAIQSELQRLYARRDGVRPPRIRMTRGALANMYVQGELYPQAISEIKSVLDDDANRADMQALLARACYQSGLKNEAADVASALLKRYPYSYDANRVMVEILGTEHPESTQLYRRRVYELDPYAAHVTASIFQSNEVSDAAVNIEHLDWNGQPVSMQSDWGESQAISLEGGAQEEQPPEAAFLDDAFTAPSQPTPAPIFDSAPPFEPAPAQPADDIPDFLREAGWGKSTGTFDESQSAFAQEDTISDSLEQADLPDWVKAMKPAEVEPAGQREEELPDWIANIGTGALASQPEELPDWLKPSEEASEEAPASAGEPPDWMSQNLGALPTETTPEPGEDLAWQNELGDTRPSSPVKSGEDLDWLKNLGETQAAASSDAGDLDWMKDLGPSEEETSADREEAADWLKGLAEPESGAFQAQSEQPDWLKGVGEAGSGSLAEESGQPDWLKDLSGTTEPSPSAGEEPIPDWLSQIGEEAESTPPVSRSTESDFLSQLSEEPILNPPSEPASARLDPLGTSEKDQEDSFAWLESLAAKQGATEGLLTRPEDRLEEEPEWIRQAKGLMSEAPPVSDSVEQPVASVEDLGKTEQDQDDSFAWLESLAAKQGATEGLLTKPEERREEEPEWVRRAKELSAQEEPQAHMPESELEQMAGMPEQEPETEAEPPASVDHTAAWLQSLTGDMPDDFQPAAADAQMEEPASAGAPESAVREDTSAWLQSLEQEQKPAEFEPTAADAQMEEPPAVSEPQEPATVDEIETWLRDLEGEGSPSEPAAAADETAIWLKGLEARETAVPEPAESAEVDLPSWMKDIAEEPTPSAAESPQSAGQPNLESTWMPPAEETQPAETKQEVETLPSWLSELEKEEEQIATQTAGDDLPDWLRSEEPAPPAPEPTHASDWKPVEEIEGRSLEDEAEQVEPAALPSEPFDLPLQEPASAAEPELQPVMEAPMPSQEPVRESAPTEGTGELNIPSIDPLLAAARNELSGNNVNGALESYDRLIRKARFLDEVIYDLREATYRYPVDVNIWQSLGDAYMRANRLQDALDAYTKAEELLR